MKKQSFLLILLLISILLVYCDQNKGTEIGSENIVSEEGLSISEWDKNGQFELKITQTGRYRVSIETENSQLDTFWIEDYIDNVDGRIYNVTGNLIVSDSEISIIDGSPLAEGKHQMRLHGNSLENVKFVNFELIQLHRETQEILTQKMEGENWKLTWSDEFNGSGLVNPTNWNYNIGDWGWGNNELQYYTSKNTLNARQVEGNLIIEAHPIEGSDKWTSARLTTQSKVSFLYGKIEFRAKVPNGLGTWAAGWLLGDPYKDELSWPYCGEIDVLECVGYEIDEAGNGMNHATCHTPAFYFKKGNQISSEIALDSMKTKFHIYAVEWYKDRIEAYIDGEHYYTYDKTANDLEWPFNQPQNIIINLAIGGGWGGLKGVDQTMGAQQYVIDYIRVYEKSS